MTLVSLSCQKIFFVDLKSFIEDYKCLWYTCYVTEKGHKQSIKPFAGVRQDSSRMHGVPTESKSLKN
jgi:hypothetical protein